jgi:hypothetical protein
MVRNPFSLNEDGVQGEAGRCGLAQQVARYPETQFPDHVGAGYRVAVAWYGCLQTATGCSKFYQWIQKRREETVK